MFAILWAVFCMGTALANSWGGLALARGAVGMAEAAMIPAGLKASSEWFPAKERSIAVGYFNVGSSIGGMLAPPLVVWAIVAHSWEMAFIITGVLSLIWAICWLLFYKHPKDQKKLSREERRYILEGREAQHQTSNAKRCPPADRAQPPVLGHRAAALSGGTGTGHLQRPDPTVHVQGLRL